LFLAGENTKLNRGRFYYSKKDGKSAFW